MKAVLDIILDYVIPPYFVPFDDPYPQSLQNLLRAGERELQTPERARERTQQDYRSLAATLLAQPVTSLAEHDNLTHLDEVALELREFHTQHRSSYEHDVRNVRLSSSPKDLIRAYSSGKPSYFTRVHFFGLNPHLEHMGRTMGVHGGAVSITNFSEVYGKLLRGNLYDLRKQGFSQDALEEEFSVYLAVTDQLWLLSAHYLNSLALPDRVRELYPARTSQPQQKPLVERVEETWFGFVYGVNNFLGAKFPRYDVGLWLGTLFGLFVGIPIALPIVGCEKLSHTIHARKNRKNCNRDDWVPLNEEDMTDRFWLYFAYRADKDVPVDFSEDNFQPCSGASSRYFPRREFIKKVPRVYDAMHTALSYYHQHPVPGENDGIKRVRAYILDKVRITEELCNRA